MVKVKEAKGREYYQCESCGFFYRDSQTAEECEDWCKQHNSCNLEITKKAVKL